MCLLSVLHRLHVAVCWCWWPHVKTTSCDNDSLSTAAGWFHVLLIPRCNCPEFNDSMASCDVCPCNNGLMDPRVNSTFSAIQLLPVLMTLRSDVVLQRFHVDDMLHHDSCSHVLCVRWFDGYMLWWEYVTTMSVWWYDMLFHDSRSHILCCCGVPEWFASVLGVPTSFCFICFHVERCDAAWCTVFSEGSWWINSWWCYTFIVLLVMAHLSLWMSLVREFTSTLWFSCLLQHLVGHISTILSFTWDIPEITLPLCIYCPVLWDIPLFICEDTGRRTEVHSVHDLPTTRPIQVIVVLRSPCDSEWWDTPLKGGKSVGG